MKYLYSGPISGVTLADGQEIMLFPAPRWTCRSSTITPACCWPCGT